MRHIKATPRYQHRLKQLRAEALAEAESRGAKKGKGKGKSKTGPVEVDEKGLEKLIDVNVQGGYSKPRFDEILIVRLALAPWHATKYAAKKWNWAYRYWIMKRPYDHDAQVILTCKRLNIARGLWETQPEKTRQHILQRQIWKPENYQAFVREWKSNK